MEPDLGRPNHREHLQPLPLPASQDHDQARARCLFLPCASDKPDRLRALLARVGSLGQEGGDVAPGSTLHSGQGFRLCRPRFYQPDAHR